MNPIESGIGKDRLEEAVLCSLVGGRLPCAVALRLAESLKAGAREMGDAADSLGIRITDCQLGCFKVKKARRPGLENRVFAAEVTAGVQRSVVDGKLPCAAAHRLSREEEIGLKEIGDAATSMGIKISHCQLGCFV